MTLYELVQSEITARQAGQLYGLRFSRNGRAFCPWHDDGKHPALGFYDEDRKCHCFVCGNGGNAIGLTAQILGISYYEAARQLQKDFNLNESVEYRHKPSTDQKPKRTVYDEKRELDKRWKFLNETSYEAYQKLMEYTPELADKEPELIIGNDGEEVEDDMNYERFTMLLDIMSTTNDELNYLREVEYPKYERT